MTSEELVKLLNDAGIPGTTLDEVVSRAAFVLMRGYYHRPSSNDLIGTVVEMDAQGTIEISIEVDKLRDYPQPLLYKTVTVVLGNINEESRPS